MAGADRHATVKGFGEVVQRGLDLRACGPSGHPSGAMVDFLPARIYRNEILHMATALSWIESGEHFQRNQIEPIREPNGVDLPTRAFSIQAFT